MKGLQIAAFFVVAALVLGATPKPVERWEGCEYVPHRNNDGDSFRVKHGAKVFVIRLQGVDCPETQASLKARLADQSKHWKTNAAGVIALGKRAADFTRTNLAAGPFTVTTRRTKVFGSVRIYGEVTLPDGRDLGASLLAADLARSRPGAR